LDVNYGTGLNESLDIFTNTKNKSNAPVLVFIHGGYWRSLDKSDHSFIAEPFTKEGAHVVIPNYALCPHVSIPQIVLQMVKAVAWVARHIHQFGGNPENMVVIGHSAGGHLATMLLACQWHAYAKDLPHHLVQRALTISGLYDLEPVRQTPFLSNLGLTPESALRASPAYMPAPQRKTLHAVVGANESAEFIRHNQLIGQAWGPECVSVCKTLPELNHFSIVDALAQQEHALYQIAHQLIWNARSSN
jgi:arylformamidase